MQGALKYSCVNVFKDKQLGHIKLNIITIKNPRLLCVHVVSDAVAENLPITIIF